MIRKIKDKFREVCEGIGPRLLPRGFLGCARQSMAVMLRREIKATTRGVLQYDVKRINLMAVDNCTNTCKYCSTSSPFAKKQCYPASAFFPWLDLLVREQVEFENIAITGGEPFLHDDIFSFLSDLKKRYSKKKIGITTNFFWANEDAVRQTALRMDSLLDTMLISVYPNVVERIGGMQRFNELIDLLRTLCPKVNIAISGESYAYMIGWKLHKNKRKVRNYCVTSDCYILRADGKISHCSIGVGLENRPEYKSIIDGSKERLFDLKNGIAGFLSWTHKYPFDLCYHCTFWRKSIVKWQDMRVKSLSTQ